MPDLDAIRARLAAANDDIGIAYSVPADEWHVTCDKPTMLLLKTARADSTTLLTELDRTTGDLAVAAEVARERGAEVERLRAVEAQFHRAIGNGDVEDLVPADAYRMAVREVKRLRAGIEALRDEWRAVADRLTVLATMHSDPDTYTARITMLISHAGALDALLRGA